MHVLFSILAFNMGQSSVNLPRVITNPPVCWPNCLGKPIYCLVSSSTLRKCLSLVSNPCSANRLSLNVSSGKSPIAPTESDRLLIASTDNPIAFATSLMAPFWCCWVTVATMAARSRPYLLYIYCITSSRRSCSKSTSISGGSFLAAEINRSNKSSNLVGLTDVIPKQKQIVELAAEPLPWQSIFCSLA